MYFMKILKIKNNMYTYLGTSCWVYSLYINDKQKQIK